jgi:hypothetical protein
MGSNFYPVRNNAPLEFLTGFIDEGDRKRLANQALKILSKETASRETVMAQIEEILTEKKKTH